MAIGQTLGLDHVPVIVLSWCIYVHQLIIASQQPYEAGIRVTLILLTWNLRIKQVKGMAGIQIWA